MFFNQYPYINLNDYNLDYILKTLRVLSERLENFIALNTIKYANPIQWNITKQYEANTVVIDANDGTAYLSVQPVPTGVAITNTDYWTPIFTLNLLSANQNITLRDDGANVLATFSSVAGDWLIWNNTLYKVSQAINVNEAYVVGYNLDRYSVELFIKDYINNIITIIGELDDLTTTDKTSIVNAINELVSVIGDLDDLTTTDKTSVVNAINELVSTAYVPIEKTVETISDLITLDCVEGDIVKTLGYYVKGDAGAAKYKIVSTNETGAVALNNGLYAIVIENILRPEMFGCVCDGVTDDYTNFNKAVVFATAHKLPLYIYNLIAIDGTINMVNWLSIIGATDGGTIDELGDKDLFYINNTDNLYYCTIKNLRLRGTNKTGRCFNFDNTGGSSNYGAPNCDICNLDISNFGMAIRLTSPWLVMKFHDINVSNCGNGIFWAGHDGMLENFEISGCTGNFGGLMVQGGYNRFTNGKIFYCQGTTYGGMTLLNPTTCKGNMLSNIDLQDNGRIGLQISGNSNICTGISTSENNHDQITTSAGILCNGSYNVITGVATNLNRGDEQNYGLSLAGQYNDIVMTCVDQATATHTGTIGNNRVVINGAVQS